MNNGNLRSYTKGSKAAKENGAKGGKASGEAKREKKRIKDILAELMEKEAPASDLVFNEVEMDFYSNAVIIAIKLMEKAKHGDLKAMRLLFEIIGELERNKTTVNVNNMESIEESELYQKGFKDAQNAIMPYLSEAELRNLIKRINDKAEMQGEKPLVLHG